MSAPLWIGPGKVLQRLQRGFASDRGRVFGFSELAGIESGQRITLSSRQFRKTEHPTPRSQNLTHSQQVSNAEKSNRDRCRRHQPETATKNRHEIMAQLRRRSSPHQVFGPLEHGGILSEPGNETAGSKRGSGNNRRSRGDAPVLDRAAATRTLVSSNAMPSSRGSGCVLVKSWGGRKRRGQVFKFHFWPREWGATWIGTTTWN